jgi:hypothetical protein
MKNFETYDVWLSAFLQLLYKSPELHLKNKRVTFVFPLSEKLHKIVTDYNCNIDVPIADYVSTVKTLRGQMLSMRNQSR